MRIPLPLAFLLLLFASCSQPNKDVFKVTSSKLDTNQIPKSIKYKGGIDTAVKFTDGDGEHVILTATDFDSDTDHRATGIYLYAYCYLITGDQWHLSWQMRDFVNECEFDIGGEFLPKTFAVTDLNHDGKAEVWLMYDLACRSDVSPSDLKIIMHEGAKKYAMRGGSRVKVNATDYYGGDYKFDAAFKNGPQAFRQYAQQLWEKNRNEGFDEEHPSGKF
jgi:hypothetical protein